MELVSLMYKKGRRVFESFKNGITSLKLLKSGDRVLRWFD